jgi:hypothetical protein
MNMQLNGKNMIVIDGDRGADRVISFAFRCFSNSLKIPRNMRGRIAEANSFFFASALPNTDAS